jgi:hypothetical protein
MSAAECVSSAVRQLTSLLKLARLHGSLENVVFAEQIPTLCERLQAVFEYERAFHIEARESLVLANRRIVKGIGQAVAAECSSAFVGYGLSGVWFGAALGEEELRTFLEVLASRSSAKEGESSAESINGTLESFGLIARVRVISVDEAGGTADQRRVSVGDADYFPLAYGRLLVLLREHARHAEEPELGRYFRQKLHRAAGEIARLVGAHRRRLMALTTIRDEQDPRFTRLANLGLLALLVGHELGLARRQLADLALAAFQGASHTLVDEVEQRAHALAGFARNRELNYTSLCTAVVGLAAPGGAGVHPYARIVRLCAAYHDLINGAEGREALRPDEAIKSLLESGGHEETIGHALANLVGVYPTGSVVRLATGAVAVVLYPNPGFPGRPLVSVARNADGSDGEGRLVDLAEQDVRGAFRVEIEASLDPAEVGIRVSDFLLG